MFRFEKNLRKQASAFLNSFRRYKSFNVAMLGASRPLGQSAALLLKQNPLVHRLSIFDFHEDTFGIALDLSHIPRLPIIAGCIKDMDVALSDSHLVLVTGGEQKKQGQTDLSLFRENANFIIHAMHEVATYCPDAFVAIATEPINYTIPLASKVLRSCYAYDKRKLFGVSLVDTMRAQAILSHMFPIPADKVNVPVIGGHSAKTVMPLFSHTTPRLGITEDMAKTLTEALRAREEEVVNYMIEETRLSTAYATYCTAVAILEALNGSTVKHVAFVDNNNYNTKFFASPIIITSQGVSGTMEFEPKTPLEVDYVSKSVKQLTKDVHLGELYCTAVREPNSEKMIDVTRLV